MSVFPIPSTALDDRLAFVGTSGSGKTYAAGTAVERALKSGAVHIIRKLRPWIHFALDAASRAAATPLSDGNPESGDRK